MAGDRTPTPNPNPKPMAQLGWITGALWQVALVLPTLHPPLTTAPPR